MMQTRPNPKNLNPLQLRTLAILQRLALVAGAPNPDGSVFLSQFPSPHGDHFHLGHAVVRTRDASGLMNSSVWLALQRKGLMTGDFPHALTLSAEALSYPVGDLPIFNEHADH